MRQVRKMIKSLKIVAIERCKPLVSIWQDVIFITINEILMCRQFRLSSCSVIRKRNNFYVICRS